MEKYLEEFTYKFQKKIVKAWLWRATGWTAGRRTRSGPWPPRWASCPGSRLRPLHPGTDPGALCLHPGHPGRGPEAGHHLARGVQALYAPLQLPRLLRGRGQTLPLPGPPGDRPRSSGRAGPAARPPSEEEFPYAIRVVSEVLSSNGSTSQGSICGSTLALMDAGVPIKAPVAGISCGLIQDDDGSFTTFIDIQGVEDFHGEMDIKVGGTRRASPHPDGPEERRIDHGDHQERPGHHLRRPVRDPGPDHAARDR